MHCHRNPRPALDRWLKTRALSNQEKGFTAVLVVHEANRVVGYYGLAPTAIVPSMRPCACLVTRLSLTSPRR